jgi:hypothetical protein
MAARFNPPPGWPTAPEGWLPPSGWQPDRDWPPAPEGWVFVIDDSRHQRPQATWPEVGPAVQPAHFTGQTNSAPKPSWVGRHKVVTFLGAGVMAVAGIAGIAAIGGGGQTSLRASGNPAFSSTGAVAASRPATPTPPASSKPVPPAPSVVSYSGRGDKVLKVRKPVDSAAIVTFTHTGSANFAVETLDSSLRSTDLLVNTIGRYSGVRLMDARDGEATTALKITADGRWTVKLADVKAAPRFATSRRGKGDAVLIYTGADAAMTFTHAGRANFAVTSYSDSGSDLLINEIGKYTGETVVHGGPTVLEVVADGAWTAQVSP